MKFFGDIVIQSKNDKDDFRSFAHVRDSEGNQWELRGYGKTPSIAAKKVWDLYNDKEYFWAISGHIIKENDEKV
jgi:hypothetical protein